MDIKTYFDHYKRKPVKITKGSKSAQDIMEMKLEEQRNRTCFATAKKYDQIVDFEFAESFMRRKLKE
jgi:hypothetical protein